jgi:hypothetical protein
VSVCTINYFLWADLHSKRYTSIAVMSVSSYDFFYHGFSDSSCRDWYLAPEALKGKFFSSNPAVFSCNACFLFLFGAVVQAMAAQAIMAWRFGIPIVRLCSRRCDEFR